MVKLNISFERALYWFEHASVKFMTNPLLLLPVTWIRILTSTGNTLLIG